ncbi:MULTISPECIES: ParB N-terminal domain-containing protein [unclassified Streptomyces]|uniref:ParB N-terminal domain-containing protein n=1 Tax=unclassified Streptomyces TaxID=2593676 RepID=UPI00381CAEDE
MARTKKQAQPFRSPVYDVQPVPVDQIRANSYNPNRVAPPELAGLENSMWVDGITQPVVTVHDETTGIYEIVDGYHRWRTVVESPRIRDREKDLLPVVVLQSKDADELKASTVRHNQARGEHDEELMSRLVAMLVDSGMTPKWTMRQLSMEPDEFRRLLQMTGIARYFFGAGAVPIEAPADAPDWGEEEGRSAVQQVLPLETPRAGAPSASPVYRVQAVPMAQIRANNYNPNQMTPSRRQLLRTSVWEDGFTQPVVAHYLADEDVYEIVDGYHRYLTMRDTPRIREREGDLLPVVALTGDMPHLMSSTVRHNRFRGTHSILLTRDLVRDVTRTKPDAWVLKHIGIGADQLLKLKDDRPLAAAYADRGYSEGDLDA